MHNADHIREQNQRLLKEAVHELGHAYNLVHCHNHPCVMLSSTYAEDIDLKSAAFCAECRKQLHACISRQVPLS